MMTPQEQINTLAEIANNFFWVGFSQYGEKQPIGVELLEAAIKLLEEKDNG